MTRLKKLSLRALSVGVAVACVLAAGVTAEAMTITLQFNSGSSQNPAADPTASGLTSIFEYCEDYYEDVFEDSHTLTINYWCSASNAAGQGDPSPLVTVTVSGGGW